MAFQHVVFVFVGLLLANGAGATPIESATSSYPQPTTFWSNASSLPVAASFGMPCVHEGLRVVVFPFWTSSSHSRFAAFSADTGAFLWELSFKETPPSVPGQYCTASRFLPQFYLGGGAALYVVYGESGLLASELPFPPTNAAGPLILTLTQDATTLFVTAGGGVCALSLPELDQRYCVGHKVYQHIDSTDSGTFFYNSVNPADNRTGLVVAAIRDGSTLWRTYANSDSIVGTQSLVAVASYNVNPNIVTIYAASTGRKLWTTTAFYDYDIGGGVFVGVYPSNMSNPASVDWIVEAREMATGERLWQTTVRKTSSPTVTGSGHVFAHGSSNGGFLTAVNLLSGNVAWQFHPPAGTTGTCIVGNGVAFQNQYIFGMGGCTAAGFFSVRI